MRSSPRRLIRPLSCACVLTLALLPITGCGGGKSDSGSTPNGGAQAAATTVTLSEKVGPPDSYHFAPTTVQLTMGGALAMENKTDEDHTITCKPDAGIGTVKIESDKTKSATFSKAGTFACNSAEHPEATLSVTVK